MNFKNCVMLLYLFVHLCTSNARIRKNPQKLAELYRSVSEERPLGVYLFDVENYIKKPKVRKEFRISRLDKKKIQNSHFVGFISEEQFVAVITSKFTYWQLEKMYKKIEDAGKCNVLVTKERVKWFLLKKRLLYRLSKKEIEAITKPMKGSRKNDAMKFSEFYNFMVFKENHFLYAYI
ncbi:uncharacterized protein LOC126847930 [Adelges cooleyi]|uniref:uncharacterized protein LOC126835116 n=1 Tax=Adelges cooleyi TaxID=133065 RepID=UPI00217F2D5F|nr:uncharacterized protein LOC126835116 [Adelges cooleyi]XP_050436331.1 uncharacterized protein LOC126843066 [Adelges cooleyi]XP_050444330.1 uncharacterized protein LOC126847930 [Adelges cooleyi]